MLPGNALGIRESWRRTLSGIPTVLGRLAYLSSLRDPNTGGYVHFGLSQKIGAEEADTILRQSHSQVFQEWLSFPLEQQRSETLEYLESLGTDAREVIANWTRLDPYQTWFPAESREIERKLFLNDLGMISELIRADFGVASPDPDS